MWMVLLIGISRFREVIREILKNEKTPKLKALPA
jgi:hypothetical protein